MNAKVLMLAFLVLISMMVITNANLCGSPCRHYGLCPPGEQCVIANNGCYKCVSTTPTHVTNAPTSAPTSVTFTITQVTNSPSQVGGGGGGSTSSTGIIGLSSQLCALVSDIRSIVGVFTLALFLIGGVLYAAAHFMPSAGQIKGSLQGWAMGMIIGGVVGLILVIIAPYIVQMIASFSGGNVVVPNC